MGSWLSYGLGSLNKNLPSFVVLLSGEQEDLKDNLCILGYGEMAF